MDIVTRSRSDARALAYPVTEIVAGAPIDPTANAVQFAFMADAVIPPTVWQSGTWSTYAVNGQTFNDATITPASNWGVTATVGTWSVWMQTGAFTGPIGQLVVV